MIELIDCSWRVGLEGAAGDAGAARRQITSLPPGCDITPLSLTHKPDVTSSACCRNITLAPKRIVLENCGVDAEARDAAGSEAARERKYHSSWCSFGTSPGPRIIMQLEM